LAAKTGINDQFTILAAIRALDVGKFFHARNLLAPRQSANLLRKNFPV
jgi:hypothetical protein